MNLAQTLIDGLISLPEGIRSMPIPKFPKLLAARFAEISKGERALGFYRNNRTAQAAQADPNAPAERKRAHRLANRDEINRKRREARAKA